MMISDEERREIAKAIRDRIWRNERSSWDVVFGAGLEDEYYVECWDCSAKVESCNGLEDAVAGWNARAIDRDELLKVADECDRAAVDGVTDWAVGITPA